MPTGCSPGCADIFRYRARGLLERHAELVDVQPGRDVGMRAGVDIRVDAHGNPRTLPSRLRGAIDALQLARRLGVDRLQAELHGPLDFVRRFADAAEDDVRRRKTGAHRQLDLADGVGIDGAAGLAQQANERRTTSSPSWRSGSGADAPRTPRRARGTTCGSTRRCRRRAACRARARCARATRRRRRAHCCLERSRSPRRILHHGPIRPIARLTYA